MRFGERRVLRGDPAGDEIGMELRLTYEGPLYGASRSTPRASHKHDIRRVFHPQLKAFWEAQPYLRHWLHNRNPQDGDRRHIERVVENHAKFGFKFAPLITRALECTCSLDILFLRPGARGGIINAGDIDNRLKTLFDALRLPNTKDELAGATPQEGEEDFFFCLLEDDCLITQASVTTDILLQPTSPNAGDNDARLVICVNFRPFNVRMDNLSFA